MPLDLHGPNAKQKLEELELKPESENAIEFGAVTDGKDAGAQVEYSYMRSWFSAAAWAEWWKNRGASAGVKVKIKPGK